MLVGLRRIAVPHWKAAREATTELFGFLEEQLAGTEDLRSSGATSYSLRELFRFNRVRLVRERSAGTMNILLVMCWFSLMALGQIVAFSSGYVLFQAGTITIGTVYLLIAYTDQVFRPAAGSDRAVPAPAKGHRQHRAHRRAVPQLELARRRR